MKKIIITLWVCIFFSLSTKAQFESIRDSIVQIYGVILSADSLTTLPGVNIFIRSTNRGTVTNPQGVFSIVAQKGDTLVISHSSFKTRYVRIPTNLATNLYSMVEVMSFDTITLPTAIITARPSKAEFERDFIAFNDVSLLNDIAMGNASPLSLATLKTSVPAFDKTATINTTLTGGWQPLNNGSGMNLLNVFNPSMWKDIMKGFKKNKTVKVSNN